MSEHIIESLEPDGSLGEGARVRITAAMSEIKWAPGVNPLGTSALAVTHSMETEQALARLLVLIPLGAADTVMAEVERRQGFMAPRAAYESVADDLVTGRWNP